VFVYDVSSEQGLCHRLPNLRYHVFISKETTKELSDYILEEPWGDENGLLYKYLDYVWRCQLFDGEIKKMLYRNEAKLVFHSGLQRRSDGEFIYLLLIRNDADSGKKVDQKWRVALGIQNGAHCHNMSFVTRHELIQYHWPRSVDHSQIPKRTLFYNSSMDLLFHSHYRFEMDWEERLRTCKNRIYKALSNGGNRRGHSSMVDEHVVPLKELQHRFEVETAKSLQLARANPRLGVPQAFIESKNGGYRLELLVPLTITLSVSGRPGHSHSYYFALALRPHHEQRLYEGMSILTRTMGYANARLVGSIDSSWLTPDFANSNGSTLCIDAMNALQHSICNGSSHMMRGHNQQHQGLQHRDHNGFGEMEPNGSQSQHHRQSQRRGGGVGVPTTPRPQIQHQTPPQHHPLSPQSMASSNSKGHQIVNNVQPQNVQNVLSPVVGSKADHHGATGMNPQNRTLRNPRTPTPQGIPNGINTNNPNPSSSGTGSTASGVSGSINGPRPNGNAQLHINAMINMNNVTVPPMAAPSSMGATNMTIYNAMNMAMAAQQTATTSSVGQHNPYWNGMNGMNGMNGLNPSHLTPFGHPQSAQNQMMNAMSPNTATNGNTNVNVNVNRFSSFPTTTTVHNPYAAALLNPILASVPNMNAGAMPTPLSMPTNPIKPGATSYLVPTASIPSVGNPGSLSSSFMGIPTVGPQYVAPSFIPIAQMSQPISTRSAASGQSGISRSPRHPPQNSNRPHTLQNMHLKPQVYSISNSQNMVTQSTLSQKSDSRSGSQHKTESAGNVNTTVTVATTTNTSTNTNSPSSNTVDTASNGIKPKVVETQQSEPSDHGEKGEDKESSRNSDKKVENKETVKNEVNSKPAMDTVAETETKTTEYGDILREASPETKAAFDGVHQVIDDPLDVDRIIYSDSGHSRVRKGMPRSNSCMLNQYTMSSHKYHSQISSKTPPFTTYRPNASLIDNRSSGSTNTNSSNHSPSHYSNGHGPPRPFDLHHSRALRDRSYDGNAGMHRTQSMVAMNTVNPYHHQNERHHGSSGYDSSHYGSSHPQRLGLHPSISANSNHSGHSNDTRSHSNSHHHSPQQHGQHHHSPIQPRYQRLNQSTDSGSSSSSSSSDHSSMNSHYPRSKSGYFFTPPVPYPDLHRGFHSPDPPMFMDGDHGVGHDHGVPTQPPFGIYDDHQHSPSGDGHHHHGNHHGGHKMMPLTKSHSQPSLSEMLAMNRNPELLEQFQAMNQEQKRQSAPFGPTVTIAEEAADTVFPDI